MLRKFNYYTPKTIKEASDLLKKVKGSIIYAGGTDILVKNRLGDERPAALIDIKNIKNLDKIKSQKDYISIGALVNFTQLQESKIIREKYTALAESADVMGCLEIRNRATIGGNIGNASPSAEGAIPLFLFDTLVKLESANNKRIVPIEKLYKWVSQLNIKKGEIISEVLLKKFPKNTVSTYIRYSRVDGMDLAGVNMAMLIINPSNPLKREIRISLGAVEPTPVRMKKIEKLLSFKKLDTRIISQAKKILSENIHPRKSSLRASPEYKKEVLQSFLDICLERLIPVNKF